MSLSTAGDHRLIAGPVAPTLLRFALPLLTTNLLHALTGTWAAIWVSHTIDENALTGVINTQVFVWLVMGVVSGVGMASGVGIGQSRGAGDITAIKRVVGSSIGFVMLLSLAIAIVGIVCTPELIAVLRVPPQAQAAMSTHLRWSCAALPILFLYILMMMMLRGSGDAATPFRFTLLWIGLSLVLMPVLLTGALGMPRLGIAGVAIGGGLANGIALLALVWHVHRRGSPIALGRADWPQLWPDLAVVRLLVQRGSPMALEAIVVQGAYFVLLAMVNEQGAATAAAYAGAAQLWGYVQMPGNAVAASISAMAAINIGAGRWTRVEEIALKGSLLGVGLTAAAAAVLYLLGDAPLRLFLPQGGEAISIARRINLIVLWGWVVVAITSCLSAVVRANGAMLPPMLVFAITMWALRIPFAKAMQPWLGQDAIWWSFPLGTVSSATLAFAYYRWGRWRDNALLLSRLPPTG